MNQMKEETDTNSIYMFCGKRCDRIKVLLHEPDGYVLLYKKLDVVHGRYRWLRNKAELAWFRQKLFGSSSEREKMQAGF